jgi:hypothetical protein
LSGILSSSADESRLNCFAMEFNLSFYWWQTDLGAVTVSGFDGCES